MIVRPVRALVVCLMLHASWIAVPHAQPAPPATAQQADAATTFNTEQLDALLAPIALYPDTLLTQVLMASTFPLQVVEAARRVEVPANKSLSGDALTKALEVETWDPSVKSLVPFPSALAMMNGNLDWMQQLGYAFADQQAQVLDSVQRLRRQAQANGNLQSTPQQTVRVVEQPQQARSVQETQQVIREEKTIIIEPAQPEVVYVPNYNPTVLYGSWPYPSYPPVYLPPPPGYAFGTALVSGLAFGAGVAITAGLWNWASPAWNRGNVNVNVNRYNNINVNRRQINSNVWQANRAGGRPAGLARPPAGPVGRPARAAGLPANAVGRPQVSVPRSAVAPPARSAGAVRQPAAGAAGQARTANRAAGQGGLAANRPAASGARPAGQQQVAANRPQREATNRPQRQGAFSGMNEGRQAGQYAQRGAQSRSAGQFQRPASGGARAGGGNFGARGGGGRGGRR